MKKLEIGKLKLLKTLNGYRIESVVTKDDQKFTLFMEYNVNDAHWFDIEYADPFFVALFPYALEFGYDIYTENPVSSSIFYGLVKDFMPTVCKFLPFFNEIKVNCDLKDKEFSKKEKIVGTGVSCGIDSFDTIIENLSKYNDIPASCSINRLFLLNTGACGRKGGEESLKRFQSEIDRAQCVCSELNIELITINTNLMEFYKIDHSHSDYLRIAGCLLGLDKVLESYYFAGGYDLGKFAFKNDDAYYLLFTLSCISDKNLVFKLVGSYKTRFDKVRYISNYPITYKYLTVCWNHDINCGKCEKCIRTMGALYAIDRLDYYSESFDVLKFQRNIIFNISKMLYFKLKSPYFYDFVKSIRKKHFWKYTLAIFVFIFYTLPVYGTIDLFKILIPKNSKLRKRIKKILKK